MPQLDLISDQTKKIPAKACQFAADVTVDSNGDSAKTAPVTMVARSGEPIDNWWWGRVVHDLGGMTISKPSIPLDYCHCEDEVIGYANKFDTTSGDLVASGALIPYSADPDDKAAEIIFKAQAGVPYEASIFFDGPLAIEEVGAGATANVNGRQVDGPVTIIRQWTLRGIAVCPYGADPNTETSMKFSRNGDVQARVLTNGAKQMSENANAEAAVVEAPVVEAQATEVAKVESEKPVESPQAESQVDKAAEGEAKPAEAEKAEAAEGDVAASPAAEAPPVEAGQQSAGKPTEKPADVPAGQRFLDAFGDRGGVWFAQGKSFDEARDLHSKELSADRERLTKENEDLRKQLGHSRGEEKPVSFSGGGDKQSPAKKEHQNLTPGLSRFSAGLDGKIKELNAAGSAIPKTVTKK